MYQFYGVMYCVDSNSSEPVMLLNRQIGQSFNEDGTPDNMPYVDGAAFQEELMWLDGQGKKRICIYINSEGGSVMDAMKICSAILQTKTPVDTYNTGVVASAAGLPFMCGRKRYMNDYALFMAHPVSGGDEKSKQAFTDSISKIISSNSLLTQDAVKFMMEQTTWIGSSACFDKNICTDIVSTNQSNKKYMPSETKAMLAYCNKLTDEIIDNLKFPTMDLKQITNKLGIIEGADLNTINNAIDVIVNGKAELQNTVNSLTAELETAKSELLAAQAKLDEAQAKIDEANSEKEAAEQQALQAEAETKATELVNTFKARISNKAEDIEMWVNKAKVDFDGTKSLLETLPLNSTGTKIDAKASTGAFNLAATMNQIALKHNQI